MIRETEYLDPGTDRVPCWHPSRMQRQCRECGTVFMVTVFEMLRGIGLGRCPWCGSEETKAMRKVVVDELP